MAKKFAEDERIEQLSQQKRRMKELEHKRDIEKLWNDKLEIYKKQREEEWEQMAKEQEEKAIYDQAVAAYKQELLDQYGPLLQEYNPKAAS